MEAAPDIPRWTLGDRLKKARDHAGYKQDELAERIDISPRSLGKYERDETRPRRHVLLAWALATGVPVAWLTDGDDGTDEQGKRPIEGYEQVRKAA